MTDDVEVKFGADSSDLDGKLNSISANLKSKFDEINSSMAGIKSQSKEMTETVKGAFEGLTGAFEKVGGAFMAVTAAMAGGAAFKEVVEATVELAMEANKLSRNLGITAQQAGILADALHDIGSSSEQYMSISQRLGRAIKNNEAGINAMGVATRDAGGHLLNQQEIMSSALSIIGEYKDGTDKNQAAMAIFGGRVGDLTALMRLNDEKMKEVAATQRELGSEITPQNVAMMIKYKDTMADVGNVINAVQKAIGDNVIPRLIALGEWFKSVGPAAVQIAKVAMMTWNEVTHTAGIVVGAFWDLIKQAFNGIGDAISVVFGPGGSGLTGMEFFINVLKVVQSSIISFRIGFEEMVNALNTGFKLLGSYAAEFGAIWRAIFIDHSLTGATAAAKAAMDDRAQIIQDGINKAVAIADKGRTDIDAALNGDKTSAAPATRKYEEAKTGSKSFTGPTRPAKGADMTGMDEQAIAEERKRSLEVIAQKEAESKHLVVMGQMSKSELLKLQGGYEDERFEIEQRAQAKRIELALGDPTTTPVALQKQLDTMIDLQQAHADKVKGISRKTAEDSHKFWQDIFSPISSAFEKSVTGMIMGTTTMSKAMANMGKAIVAEFVTMGVKRVTSWLADEATMLFATKAKDTAVGASGTVGLGAVVSAKTTEAGAVVGANAAEGAAGAAASQAAIPIVGPGMAVAAFAATMALILGAKSLIPSSAGGEWNVPSDRLNFVHKNETILPASIATPLRNMVEGNGGGSGMTINIHATDAQSVQRLFEQNGKQLVNSLRKQLRSFNTGIKS